MYFYHLSLVYCYLLICFSLLLPLQLSTVLLMLMPMLPPLLSLFSHMLQVFVVVTVTTHGTVPQSWYFWLSSLLLPGTGWLLLLTDASPIMSHSCYHQHLLHWNMCCQWWCHSTAASCHCCLPQPFPPCIVCCGLCHCFMACTAVLMILLSYPLSLLPAASCFLIAISTVTAISWLLLIYFTPLTLLVMAITMVDCCFLIFSSSVVAVVVTTYSNSLQCAGTASTATLCNHLTLLLAIAINAVDCCLFLHYQLHLLLLLLASLQCNVLAQPPLLLSVTNSILFLSLAINAVAC